MTKASSDLRQSIAWFICAHFLLRDFGPYGIFMSVYFCTFAMVMLLRDFGPGVLLFVICV
jgi:hypothetical protein